MMFQTPTTIILGAGASYEFGAPLGADLWTRIARDTKKIHETYENERRGTLARAPIVRISTELPLSATDPKAVAYVEEIKSLLGDADVVDAIMQAPESAAAIRRR